MPATHIDENVLERYSMGTAPVESIPEIEEHLLSCSFCQKRLVEADEFLLNFRAAAEAVVVRQPSFWERLRGTPRLIWSGSAVAATALAVILITGEPRFTNPTPSVVLLQSLRGPEAPARMASGRPGLLVFDVPVTPAQSGYEVEIVDTAGNRVLRGSGKVKDDRITFEIDKLSPASYWVRVYQKTPGDKLVAEYGLETK
jgi:hypothetical protein